MNTDFQSHYETLGLTAQTDWKTVQSTYRKLVHDWHPDRHRDSEEDGQRAETKFIQLTQAFNVLRDFYRANDRLPLQRPDASTQPRSSKPGAPQGHSPDVSDADITDSGLLGSRRNIKASYSVKSFFSKNRFLFGAAAVMLLALTTMGLMYKLDKRNAQMAKAERKDVLRTVEPSKFERSSLEIQRAVTTGAFLEVSPEKSALGNQIRGDSFSKNRKR